jgi:hypothetical protein
MAIGPHKFTPYPKGHLWGLEDNCQVCGHKFWMCSSWKEEHPNADPRDYIPKYFPEKSEQVVNRSDTDEPLFF